MQAKETGNQIGSTDHKNQFSKRLARWTAVFWFLFMSWLSVIFILEPMTAMYNVYMGIIATIVMIVNVWAYTKNSIYEKSVLAMLDKTRLELSLKAGRKESSQAMEGNTDEEADEEGGGNG